MDLEPQNEPQPPQQLDKQLAVAATPLPSHVIPPRPRYGLRVPTSKDFMLPTRGFVQPEQFPELFEAIARFKANLGGRPAVVISCRLCYFCSLDPGQFLGHCELHPLYRMSQRKPDTDGTIFAKCSRCHELVCFGRYRNAEGKFLSARPDLEGFYLLELSQEQLKQESQHSDLKIGTIKRHLLHRAQASNHYARQALEEPRLRAPLFENLHLRSFLQCSRLPKELAESYSVFVWAVDILQNQMGLRTPQQLRDELLIVDVCSGKGFTPFVLSHMLPATVPIVMIDNNRRMNLRHLLGLPNVRFELFNIIGNPYNDYPPLEDFIDYLAGKVWDPAHLQGPAEAAASEAGGESKESEVVESDAQQQARDQADGDGSQSIAAAVEDAANGPLPKSDSSPPTAEQDPVKRRKVLMLGMHLCGDLSLSFIKAFHRSRTASAMVLVPCCLPGNRRELKVDAYRRQEDPHLHWCRLLQAGVVEPDKLPDDRHRKCGMSKTETKRLRIQLKLEQQQQQQEQAQAQAETGSSGGDANGEVAVAEPQEDRQQSSNGDTGSERTRQSVSAKSAGVAHQTPLDEEVRGPHYSCRLVRDIRVPSTKNVLLLGVDHLAC